MFAKFGWEMCLRSPGAYIFIAGVVEALGMRPPDALQKSARRRALWLRERPRDALLSV